MDMRLIDADALLDAISVHLERIEQEFDDAPTIDPVKHGLWEGVVNEHGEDEVVCSECGFVNTPELMADNYCPNCGARMDGDE